MMMFGFVPKPPLSHLDGEHSWSLNRCIGLPDSTLSPIENH